LLFNTRNTLELVGKVSIWRNELPFALYNSNIMRLKFNHLFEDSNRYMNYFFNTKDSIEQLRSFATGTTSVAAIYGRDLKSFKISFPCIEEQVKIANFLSSLDEKINHCQKQIEQTEQWKKGLLQKMFC
jgi:type I restriction enzyme, S subunit